MVPTTVVNRYVPCKGSLHIFHITQPIEPMHSWTNTCY
jgi:hypothetical protein